MALTKTKAYFREILVSNFTFSQIHNLMEQAGIDRVHGAGQNYFKGKPSKPSLVDEYYKGAERDRNGDEKLLEAIKLLLSKYEGLNPPTEVENLIKALKDEKQSAILAPYGEAINSVRTHIESTEHSTEKSEELRDVFLCHASKDKEDYIRPFLERLKREKITYWYDEAEIKWGDSLVGKISEGLRKSKYIILFISKNFLEGNWTEKELNAALGMEIGSGGIKALPLFIGDASDIKLILEKYPLLADKKYEKWNKGIEALIGALKIRLGENVGYAGTIMRATEKREGTSKENKKELHVNYKILSNAIIGGIAFISVGFTLLAINFNFFNAPNKTSTSIPKVHISQEYPSSQGYSYNQYIDLTAGDPAVMTLLSEDQPMWLGMINVDTFNIKNPILFLNFDGNVNVDVKRPESDRWAEMDPGKQYNIRINDEIQPGNRAKLPPFYVRFQKAGIYHVLYAISTDDSFPRRGSFDIKVK
ncbi:MAG: toll/interleukin-1 receptor domain-containing protein [Candidatus Omnitrophota bacterium]